MKSKDQRGAMMYLPEVTQLGKVQLKSVIPAIFVLAKPPIKQPVRQERTQHCLDPFRVSIVRLENFLHSLALKTVKIVLLTRTVLTQGGIPAVPLKRITKWC